MSFDRIAPFYDFLARLVFGKAIVKAQTRFLHQIPAGATVLIIGGGTGWILGELFSRAQPGKVLYLEASPRMMAEARQKAMPLPPEERLRITFRTGTEQDLLPGEQFDAVLTFFFLDLFTPLDLPKVFDRLNQALKPGGTWLVADFHIPSRPPFKQLARWLIALMYGFFRIASGVKAKHLPDFQGYFSALGFRSQEIAYFYHGIIRSEWLGKDANINPPHTIV